MFFDTPMQIEEESPCKLNWKANFRLVAASIGCLIINIHIAIANYYFTLLIHSLYYIILYYIILYYIILYYIILYIILYYIILYYIILYYIILYYLVILFRYR